MVKPTSKNICFAQTFLSGATAASGGLHHKCNGPYGPYRCQPLRGAGAIGPFPLRIPICPLGYKPRVVSEACVANDVANGGLHLERSGR